LSLKIPNWQQCFSWDGRDVKIQWLSI
jgi:hypothetical protein